MLLHAVMALQEADRGGEAIARFMIPTATCHVTMWRHLLQRRACSAHAQTPSASLRHEASKRHLLYVIEQGAGHGRSGNNRLQRARLGVNHVTPLVTGTVHPAALGEEEKEERKGKKERGGGG